MQTVRVPKKRTQTYDHQKTLEVLGPGFSREQTLLLVNRRLKYNIRRFLLVVHTIRYLIHFACIARAQISLAGQYIFLFVFSYCYRHNIMYINTLTHDDIENAS